jgi:hypothetical protein
LRKENQQPKQAIANKVYELRNTGALVNYLHKALFSPTKHALLQAVKNGHLVTWPNGESNQQTFQAHSSHNYGSHESKTPKH